MTLVEDQNDEEAAFEEEPVAEAHVTDPQYEDQEILEGDVGEVMVIQRTLLTSPVPSDDRWLRHNIFRTTCTSGGKVCTILIYGGSSENFVSREMVDK